MDLSLDDIIKQNKKTAKRPTKKPGAQKRKTIRKTSMKAKRPTKKMGTQNRKAVEKTRPNAKKIPKRKPTANQAQTEDPCAMSLEDIIRNKKVATKTALKQRQIAKSKAKLNTTKKTQPQKAAPRKIQAKKTIKTQPTRRIQTKVTASGKVVKLRKIQRASTTKGRKRAGGVSARSKVIQKKRVRAVDSPKKVIRSARDVSDARLYLTQKTKTADRQSAGRQAPRNLNIPSTNGTRNGRNWSTPRGVLSASDWPAPSTSGLRSEGYERLPDDRHDLRHMVHSRNQRSFVTKYNEPTNSANYRGGDDYRSRDYLDRRSPPRSADYRQLRRTIASDVAPRHQLQQSEIFGRQKSAASRRRAVREESEYPGFHNAESGSSNRDRIVQYDRARSTTLETERRHPSASHNRCDVLLETERRQPSASRNNCDVPDRHHGVAADGYRVVISNLPLDISRDDIEELFDAMGRMKDVRLIRPGIGEVVFFNSRDANKAIDTYHNRRLDDRPMKCRLLSPR